jgi:hypothetical protein
MIRFRFWRMAMLLCTPPVALACTGSEPRDEEIEMPELVYAEFDEPNDLWSIRGYTEGRGSGEMVPGPAGLPRPVTDFLLVRPTTGELLYVSEELDIQGYVLLNPASGEFQRPDLPGSVQEWSPNGDLLTTYFGDAHLVVTVEGAVRATICSPTISCGVPRWTPSGDAVVVFRQPAGSETDLWLVPLSGAAEVNLTQTANASEISPSYSPDGHHLVYERRPNFEVVVSNADGSDARPLLSPANLGNFPWPPDGLSVAVHGSVGGQFGLALVPLDGNPRLITPPDQNLTLPTRIAWSPDGNRLAYGAYDGTPSDVPGVFLINVDGTGRRQLNTPGTQAYGHMWMPDLP